MSKVMHSCIDKLPPFGRRWFKVLSLVLGGLLLVSLQLPNGWAQLNTGSITGYVTDPSGAAVPNVNVTVTEVRTGIATKGVADSAGFYNITHLLPGEYTVVVETQGFKRFIQEHVTVQIDSAMRVDAKLEMGAVTQEVTVTAAPALLQSQKTDVSRNVNEQTIEALPVMYHNLTKLFDVVPGAVESMVQIGLGETPSGATSVVVNGMWFGANDYNIDGITDVACCFSNQLVIAPNQDSVSEIKMSASNYDPEFGNSAGMIAQYVTKSGTNVFHGSVWWANMNKATFAANPFTEKIAGTGPEGKGLGPSPFNQNQGAFSLGGPIKKNKMFVFGDYQLLRLAETNTLTATVPIQAWRQGDFSALAATNPIFDPLTGNPDGSGRTQFACNGALNVICPGRIGTVATNLVNLLPPANIGQNSADPYDVNYVGSGPTAFRTDQFDVRWDYNITDKDKIFLRNTYMYSFLNTPALFGTVAGGPSTGGLGAEIVPTHDDQIALNYTHTFGSNLLTEFRGGLLRWHLQGYTPDANLGTNTQVGLAGLNLGGKITGGLAGFTIEGPTGTFTEGPGGNATALPRLDIINVWQGVNNWTWVKGAHQLRWGADIRRNMEDLFTVNAHTSGYFDFDQEITGTPDVANSGLGSASFMLGLPDTFERGVYNFIPHERQWREAFYFQDSWRVTPKLTANYGLRWDYFGPDETDIKGGLSNFDPSTGDVNLANLGGVSSTTNVDGYHKGWAPRLGLAYKLTNNTVIRSGFGRSYFATNYSSTFQQLSIVFPISGDQDILQTNLYQPALSFGSGVTIPLYAPFSVPSSGHLQVPNGATVYYNPAYTPTEHVDQWNFVVERLVGRDLRVSLGYVGTKGTDLAFDPNINAANICPAGENIEDCRPYYQQYGLAQGIGSRNNGANSSYNGMQFVVDKRFSNGYSIASSFTWSKSLDTEIAGFAYGDQGIDPYDRNGSRGVGVNQDRAAVWTLTHNWQLPYGQGLHWGSNATGVKKWVLGGWQFNGVTTVEDGFALSPTMASGATLNADWGQRPDRIPGVPLYPATKTSGEWFNDAAFEAPQFPGQATQCCRWGDAARGSFRSPGLVGTDYALWKEFVFHTPLNREDTRLQIRWENFNAFNKAPWGEPDTNIDDATAGRITNLLGCVYQVNQTMMRRMIFTVRLQF